MTGEFAFLMLLALASSYQERKAFNFSNSVNSDNMLLSNNSTSAPGSAAKSPKGAKSPSNQGFRGITNIQF